MGGSPPPRESPDIPDEPPTRESPPPDPDQSFADQEPNLAVAITLMTEELRRRDGSSRAPPVGKTKEPDTFDGSHAEKLNNFILLCNLHFRNNPAYASDEAKVTFALSYLRGMALEYFEPAILDSDETPDWIDNWSAFIRTLRVQFGPIDPTADAERGLDNLKMQENQHIIKYNVEFTKFAIQTGWDEGVLRHRYYSGLAERIKDVMGQHPKPRTLEDMKILAHGIDARYWERHREKTRSDKSKPDKSDKSDKPDNKPDGKPEGKFDKKGKGKDKSPKPSTSSGSSNPLNEKLGKDGKLTPQERQRRFDNRLCMFCGGVGHTAKDCPKSTSSSSKAKARASTAKEKEKEPVDPKKG
jgi:Retrotransposon gag protein/Zinc knuckle